MPVFEISIQINKKIKKKIIINFHHVHHLFFFFSIVEKEAVLGVRRSERNNNESQYIRCIFDRPQTDSSDPAMTVMTGEFKTMVGSPLETIFLAFQRFIEGAHQYLLYGWVPDEFLMWSYLTTAFECFFNTSSQFEYLKLMQNQHT